MVLLLFRDDRETNKYKTCIIIKVSESKMEQYTVANVEMAVLQFFSGAPQDTHCHQWLTSAQTSPAAWNFSWELLMPEKKLEVQYFGANTIAIKVSKYWHEVPTEQVGTSEIM